MPDILTREEIDTVADVWSKVAPETEDQAEDKKHILQLCDTARHYWCEMVDAEDKARRLKHDNEILRGQNQVLALAAFIACLGGLMLIWQFVP